MQERKENGNIRTKEREKWRERGRSNEKYKGSRNIPEVLTTVEDEENER